MNPHSYSSLQVSQSKHSQSKLWRKSREGNPWFKDDCSPSIILTRTPHFLTNLYPRKGNNNDTCMRHMQFPSVELNLLGIISRGPDCILGDSQFGMYRRHNDYLLRQAMNQAEAPTSFSLSFVQCLEENIGKRSNFGNWMSWKLQLCSALQHSTTNNSW